MATFDEYDVLVSNYASASAEVGGRRINLKSSFENSNVSKEQFDKVLSTLKSMHNELNKIRDEYEDIELSDLNIDVYISKINKIFLEDTTTSPFRPSWKG